MTYLQKLVSEYLTNNPAHNAYFAMFDLSKTERCFHAITFSPEKRAVYTVADFAERCENFIVEVKKQLERAKQNGANLANGGDVEAMIQDAANEYKQALKGKFDAYLNAESRCMSSAIVGPARFPTERAMKRSDIAMRRYEDINETAAKLLKRTMKALLPDGDGLTIRSDASNAAEQLENKVAAMKAQQANMKAINALVRKSFPKGQPKPGLTPQDIDRLVDELMTQFKLPEMTARTLLKPCRITGKVVPYASFTLSNFNQNLKRYESRLAEQNALDARRDDKTDTALNGELENGISYFLTDDNRIAIDFGYKPDEATRKTLKRHAFKFSSKRGNLWVRKHTFNAQAAFGRHIMPVIKALDAQ